MAKVELVQSTSDDRGEVTLEMRVDGDPKAHMILSASDLDDLIAKLWKRRAEMAEEVSREIDPGFRIETIVDPIWRGVPQSQTAGKALVLRHPGLGWLGFALPPAEAQSIARWLLLE